jgi:peptidoglycan/xylan/chitin deacetylase (PgdA/CDA1 family)
MLADNFIWNYDGVKDVHHINFSEYPRLYDGHEVASHTVRHLHLESLSYLAKKNEIQLDQIYLKALYGYDICGMALPFGSYDDEVVKVLKELNILYCRTTKSTYKFNIPDCLPLLHPTCHFRYKDLDKLTDEFLNAQNDGDMLFYIWGHSYEFDRNNNWEILEEFCQRASGHEDVWYATNIQICDYVKAYEQLEFNVDNTLVYNPTNTTVWFEADANMYKVEPGQTIQLKETNCPQ